MIFRGYAEKTLALFCVFVLFVAHVFSIDSRWIKTIEPSVVLITQQVFLAKRDSSEPGLWAKLEKHLKTRILDDYTTVFTGTGFFVDGEGRILTNQHVVDKGDEGKVLRELINNIQAFLSYSVPDSVLTTDERFKLRIDIAKLLKDKKIELRCMTSSGDFMTAETVSVDEKLDLALLRVKTDRPTQALPLSAQEVSVDIGDSVIAIGYPLFETLDNLFKDKSLTVTQGNVSAIHDDVWGIQHTAPLNPGNSGGPLLDKNGVVVGVNVGEIRNANSLFFAIDSQKIIRFFSQSGSFGVFEANRALTKAAGAVKSTLSEWQVGDTVILNSDKNAEVYQDGKRIGVIPMILTLTKDTSLITVRGARGESSVVLNRDPSITKTITVDIELAAYKGTLSLQTTPPGAIASVDGTTQGKTPLESELSEGSHLLQVKTDGFFFEDQKITIKREQKLSLNLQGAKTYDVSFAAPIPPGTHITLTNGEKSFSFTDPQIITIPEGKWEGTVENEDYFKPTTFVIDTSDLAQLDPRPWYENGSIRFQNIFPESTLFIDGESIGPVMGGTEYPLSCGVHDVKIVNKKYEDFVQSVVVEKSKVVNVLVLQNIDKKERKKRQLRIWGIATIACFAVAIPSMAYGLSEYNDAYSSRSNYNEAVEPNIYMYVGGYGMMAGSVTGLVYYFTLLSKTD